MSATGGEPDGLIMHSCFREGDGLAVFDVWESQEKFEAMAPVLMPIVAELNAELGAPQFLELIDYLVQ
jgi:cytochrome c556